MDQLNEMRRPRGNEGGAEISHENTVHPIKYTEAAPIARRGPIPMGCRSTRGIIGHGCTA